MAFISLINVSKLESTRRIDSEYYRPEYVHAFEQLLRCNTIPLHKVAKISDGNHLKIAGDFLSSGVRYLRGQDISTEMLLDDRNEVYIPESAFNSLERSHIFNNDVLMTIVGANTGLVGLVYDAPKQLTANCKLGIARPKNIDAAYLYAFLSSKYGQFQILRAKRGGGQTGLILPDMRNLFIARWSKSVEDKISAVAYRAHSLVKKSKNVLLAAEKLLLSELGLLDWKPKHTHSFIRRYSEAAQSRRADAEYFQPKYDEIISSVKKFQPSKLVVYAAPIRKVVNFKTTELYRYIEIGDVNTSTGEVSFTLRETKDLPANAKIEVKGGELLVSKVRPTRGAVGIVPDECAENGVASGAFAVYKIESPMREFIKVFLRSVVGKMQLEKPSKGTSYPTIENVDVNSILIPSFNSLLIKEISDLVKQAHEARREANRLLQLAKRAVEIAVEENEQEALEFINSN